MGCGCGWEHDGKMPCDIYEVCARADCVLLWFRGAGVVRLKIIFVSASGGIISVLRVLERERVGRNRRCNNA